MKEAIWFMVILGIWIFFNAWLLPKMGVRTWMSPNGCPVDQEENIETNDNKIDIEKKDGIKTINIDRS